MPGASECPASCAAWTQTRTSAAFAGQKRERGKTPRGDSTSSFPRFDRYDLPNAIGEGSFSCGIRVAGIGTSMRRADLRSGCRKKSACRSAKMHWAIPLSVMRRSRLSLKKSVDRSEKPRILFVFTTCSAILAVTIATTQFCLTVTWKVGQGAGSVGSDEDLRSVARASVNQPSALLGNRPVRRNSSMAFMAVSKHALASSHRSSAAFSKAAAKSRSSRSSSHSRFAPSPVSHSSSASAKSETQPSGSSVTLSSGKTGPSAISSSGFSASL